MANNMKKLTILIVLAIAVFLFMASALVNIHRVYLPIVLKSFPAFTSTPTQTSTPNPTATSIPPGVSILNNHGTFLNYGDLYIVGEVYNNTANNLRDVTIYADMFNGGQLVATYYAFTFMEYLPAHEKTCFRILIPNPPAWDSYQFEAPTYSGYTGSIYNLTLLRTSGYIDNVGWYHLLGQVRNDDASAVRWVQPVGTLYNAQGRVVDCQGDRVNSTDLTPGQTSAFDIYFFGEDYSSVTNYHLQVSGYPPQ